MPSEVTTARTQRPAAGVSRTAMSPLRKILSPAHVTGSAVTHSAAHETSLSLASRADRGGYVIAALSGELGTASAPALRS